MIGSKEAAAILGVDRGTLNRWAARGDIPVAYKVTGETGSRLFDPKDVEKFAKARALNKPKMDVPLDLEADSNAQRAS